MIGHQLALLDTVPYQGRYSTPEWQPEQTFADEYRWTMPGPQDEPVLASVMVSLYPVGRPQEKLPVMVTEGPVGDEFAIAQFKLEASHAQEFAPEQPANTSFDERFRLFGYDMPETIRASQPFSTTLYWESLAPDGQDYTVFVHLYDETGEVVAQGDSPPKKNQYPTSFWSAGEKIADTHLFTGLENVTAGNYRLVIGLYDPISGRRLAAFQADGQQWPDDTVFLGNIRGIEDK